MVDEKADKCVRMYIVLGDWSDDGHGKTEKVLVETNCDVVLMQEAYRNSCKLTGISFNQNDDFTGVKRSYEDKEKYQICSEYENNYLSKECVVILEKHGCKIDEYAEHYDDSYSVSKDQFVSFLMWFISLSLPSLKWNEVKNDIPCFNGYWGKLNVAFGDGFYF